MKTAAIICEYNPFHFGHEAQIAYIRENTDADRVIAIMSGDFTQRGEPALFSKEARTRMALSCGADAVFLLPVAYSTGGAEIFARAGVAIAMGLNVDYLCFGSESGDMTELLSAAASLRRNGTADSPIIKQLMWEGHTFAKARAMAFPEFERLLSTPNNVLAIEYIIASLDLDAGFKLITHPRQGAAYNETAIIPGERFQSASSLRRLVYSGPKETIVDHVPKEAGIIINDELILKHSVRPDDFSDILYTKLLFMKDNTEYLEVSEDLLNRIRNNLSEYMGFTAFADLIKSKDVTKAGVRRALIHILLDLNRPLSYYKDVTKITHVRLLGFRDDSSDLLTHIKETGTLKLVSKVPDVLSELDGFNRTLFEENATAAALYEYVKCSHADRVPTPEYSKPIIKI